MPKALLFGAYFSQQHIVGFPDFVTGYCCEFILICTQTNQEAFTTVTQISAELREGRISLKLFQRQDFEAFSLFIRQVGHMDSLDHCFCMFQVETKMKNETTERIQASPETDATETCMDTCPGGRGGSAVRRVDLIVTPPKQFPFALLGWTGSKVKKMLHVYIVL